MSKDSLAPLLVPPFTSRSSISSSNDSSFPASFWHQQCILDPQKALPLFLENDLKTPKLNALYEYLWLAGLLQQARPLHRQKLLGRMIRLTESPDEHLVWHKGDIYIKAIPGYLLDYEFWRVHLCVDEPLFANATGLLLSYVWLIASANDYAIAVEERIFPSSVPWEAWRDLVRDMLRNIDTITARVDRRYHYGELRLSRLNSLYRFTISTFSAHNFMHGFISTPTWYTQFFEKNFSWILAAFIYTNVILSAMQVGLATSHLEGSAQFQNVSYGIAVTAIVLVLAAMVVMLLVWVVLFWFHLYSAMRHSKKETAKRLRSEKSSL
jgi:uncharacterized membrane protein